MIAKVRYLYDQLDLSLCLSSITLSKGFKGNKGQDKEELFQILFLILSKINPMISSKIKKQILHYVNLIEDEFHLQMLHDLSAAYANKNPMDIIEYLPPDQLERLEKSVRQSKIGNTLAHEEVKQISKQWLGE